MKQKIMTIGAYALVGLLLAFMGYSIWKNTGQELNYNKTASVGRLLDARNDYALEIARPLVEDLVDAILYIRKLDKDLASYGVRVDGNQYLFVDIEGVTYKIGIDKVQ